jgi:hypothetical protein
MRRRERNGRGPGSVLFEGVEAGEWAAELHEASALAQGAEVDGGEAEGGSRRGWRRPRPRLGWSSWRLDVR